MYRAIRLFPILLGLSVASTAAAEDMLPPQIVHEPCEYYQKGQAFSVEALFYDDSPIFDPKVVYRTKKVPEWRSASFTKSASGPEFVATIKGRDLRGTLEYFIETFDENGNGPARYGSPEAPVRLNPIDQPVECFQTGQTQAPVVTSVGSSEVAAPAPEPEAETDDSGRKKKKKKKKRGRVEEEPEEPEEPEATESETAETTAAPGEEVAAIGQEVPEPARTGCDADDPPGYCSPVLWALLGVGLVVAGTTGGVLGWCFSDGPCAAGPEEEEPVPDRVSIEVGATDFNTVYGLSF